MELRTLLLRIAMRLHVNPRSSTVQQVMYRCAPPGKRFGAQLHRAISGPYRLVVGAFVVNATQNAMQLRVTLSPSPAQPPAQGCH